MIEKNSDQTSIFQYIYILELTIGVNNVETDRLMTAF